MARGTWAGIYQGYKDFKAADFAEKERQDRLDAINQAREDRLAERKEAREMFDLERADKYVNNSLDLAGEYAKSGATIGSKSSTQLNDTTAGAIALRKWGMSEEDAINLAEQGPAAVNEALNQITSNFDSKIPFTQEDFSQIAESIIYTPKYVPTVAEAEAFARDQMGTDFTRLNDQQKQKLVSGIQRKLARGESAMSTFGRAKPTDVQDLKVAEDSFINGITTFLDTKEREQDQSTPEGIERATQIRMAKDSLEKNSPMKAVEVLATYDPISFTKFYESWIKTMPNAFGPESTAPIVRAEPFKELYKRLTEEGQDQVPRLVSRINPETGELELVE